MRRMGKGEIEKKRKKADDIKTGKHHECRDFSLQNLKSNDLCK